jgi:MscS family membrane protein
MKLPDFVEEALKLFHSYEPFLIKIAVILLSIAVIYFIRKILLDVLESLLLKIHSFEHYSKHIIHKLRKPVEILTIIINIDLILFIYNDYSTISSVKEVFTIIYVVMLTWMIFLFINATVSVKIENFERLESVKNEVINLGLKILNFTIFLVGGLVALHFAGIDLTAILSGLGIGGLAVALAAKDSLANFFGTLSILMSNTFSQGDWIVANASEGIVVEIGLRVTTIRTFDNALISIPNASLANSDVKNWSKRTLGRRIKMNLGVKYDSKSSDIKNAIIEIREMLHKHPKIATEETAYNVECWSNKLVSRDDINGIKKDILVYLDEFSTSSINILVYCFSASTKWEEWLVVKEDVMHKIMDIFEKNSLEFAFPSLSVYHENESV